MAGISSSDLTAASMTSETSTGTESEPSDGGTEEESVGVQPVWEETGRVKGTEGDDGEQRS